MTAFGGDRQRLDAHHTSVRLEREVHRSATGIGARLGGGGGRGGGEVGGGRRRLRV